MQEYYDLNWLWLIYQEEVGGLICGMFMLLKHDPALLRGPNMMN